jgi:hypothetical protein
VLEEKKPVFSILEKQFVYPHYCVFALAYVKVLFFRTLFDFASIDLTHFETMFTTLLLFVLIGFLSFNNAFLLNKAISLQRIANLNMVGTGGPDPLEAIRAKMKADPSYDPMKDPEAMRVLESKLPPQFREFPNAIQRLRVAITDATTGVEAVDNLDARAADFPDKKELISSPQSEWFQSGLPTAEFNAKEKAELLEKLKKSHPNVPRNKQA